jgi:hypothetical protein
LFLTANASSSVMSMSGTGLPTGFSAVDRARRREGAAGPKRDAHGFSMRSLDGGAIGVISGSYP